jgi:hypothetical protein
VEEQWCSLCGLVLNIRTVVSFNWCWSNALLTLLGAPHLVDGLVLLAAVVLPTHPLHAVTKLLELLVTKLALIHYVAVLCTAMSTVNLYPVILL